MACPLHGFPPNRCLGEAWALEWNLLKKRGMIFMKTITLKVSEALDARLRAVAKKRGTNKAAIVRAALESFLVSFNETSKKPILGLAEDALENKTCFALARDLAGSVSGPPDLATNKKWLEGYGE